MSENDSAIDGSILSLHIAKDTDSGVETLCGKIDAMAVYPKQLGNMRTIRFARAVNAVSTMYGASRLLIEP